jgi:hypothetical protein
MGLHCCCRADEQNVKKNKTNSLLFRRVTHCSVWVTHRFSEKELNSVLQLIVTSHHVAEPKNGAQPLTAHQFTYKSEVVCVAINRTHISVITYACI